jgi:hypothetical protein
MTAHPATSFPYTRTPGGATPAPETPPDEGRSELWTFFWLSLACTAIIAVVGLAVWLPVHY